MLTIPSRIHRHFRDTFDDFGEMCPMEHAPWPVDRLVNRARSIFAPPGEHHHHSSSSATTHGNRFHFSVPLSSFEPSEVSVRFDDTTRRLVVHAKRERKDENGGGDGGSYVYKEHRQEVTVPENVIGEQLKARFDSGGCLRIEAPLKESEPKRTTTITNREKYIPIEHVRGGGGSLL